MHEKGNEHMAGEVEAEMGVLTRVMQAKDTLVTHGAAGCLNVSARASGCSSFLLLLLLLL